MTKRSFGLFLALATLAPTLPAHAATPAAQTECRRGKRHHGKAKKAKPAKAAAASSTTAKPKKGMEF